MCESCSCMNPQNLKGKPEDCTSEQIKKCHGDEEGHPCVEAEQEKK